MGSHWSPPAMSTPVSGVRVFLVLLTQYCRFSPLFNKLGAYMEQRHQPFQAQPFLFDGLRGQVGWEQSLGEVGGRSVSAWGPFI